MLPVIGGGVVSAALITLNTLRANADRNALVEVTPFTRPNKLDKGDCIGICAPAGALRREAEVAEFGTILEELGFRVKVGTNVYKQHGYFAGTDEERASDFMDFIEDPEVRGVFFLRGGWGCARLLPLLDFDSIRRSQKVIMGFSDATSLLNAITEHSRLVTFHGPSGNSSWNAYSRRYLQLALLQTQSFVYENNHEDHEIVTYSGGSANGTLWGGNLSVVTSMIGTPWFPKIQNGILFLEEVGEEPYRIDRMLTQIKQAGVLEKCNGIILGSFRKCFAEEPERAFTLEEVFEQHFGNFGKPVYHGAQIGHTVNKYTVPIGVEATMNADTGTFQLQISAVK